jgi:hypothetical protein
LISKHLSSRERMLAALACREADYVPCCFGSFNILREQCASQAEFLDRQLEMGLDVIARISIPEPHFDARVQIREWREEPPGEPYPILHKEYHTPAGTLRTSVEQREDWPWGDHIPLMDDYLIPRSRKFLVTPDDNLEALRYLLAPPTEEDVARFRTHARHVKALAAERDLLVAATYGTVGDLAVWLSGLQELVLLTVDDPDFVHRLLGVIEEWNRRCVALAPEEGVDLVIRRAWYENADFWSPPSYRRFLLPGLRQDAEMAHQAGAKFGYLMSCASMPLIETMIEAGVDVLMGVDPAQDRTMDLRALKRQAADKMCLWGGVCGYLTVERGTPEDIATEVRQAISILAPGGGFILAPVTNVRADTPRAWENVRTMIRVWRSVRQYDDA